jgi:threonine dehydrogenase-like Zn-dependent dehydrogenase
MVPFLQALPAKPPGYVEGERRMTVMETPSTPASEDVGRPSEGLRAVRVTAPGQVEVVSLPLPEPGPGEIRVRLEGSGVCASNLEPWAGPEWMSFPTEPGGLGHEGWGVVEAVGDGVTAPASGDRVAILGQHSYASHDVVKAEQAVRLPPELDGLPFPGEAFGCVMNIFRRSGVVPGQTVAIIGIGFLGAALTRLAEQAGAEVIAISRRDSSLALAREMGASHAVPMHDHWAIIEEVRRLTSGRFCDVVIEAVGKQWPLDLAGEIVAEGGRLVVAGYHQDGPRQVNMQNWNWRGIDVINAHERDPARYVAGLHQAVEAVAAGRLDPRPLMTHRFPLDRLGEALDATRDKPEGFVKAWIDLA